MKRCKYLWLSLSLSPSHRLWEYADFDCFPSGIRSWDKNRCVNAIDKGMHYDHLACDSNVGTMSCKPIFPKFLHLLSHWRIFNRISSHSTKFAAFSSIFVRFVAKFIAQTFYTLHRNGLVANQLKAIFVLDGPQSEMCGGERWIGK